MSKLSMKQLVALALTVNIAAGTAVTAFAQTQEEIHEMRIESRNVDLQTPRVSDVEVQTTQVEATAPSVDIDVDTEAVETEIQTESGTSAVREIQTTTTTTTTTTTNALGSPVVLGSASTIPANTTVYGTLATGLFTENNDVGDKVKVILDHPLMTTNGQIVLPSGSIVKGKISEIQDSDSVRDAALIGINFDEIETPAGLKIPVTGTIASADGKLLNEHLSGVAQVPNASFKGLQADMNRKVGGWYGTERGKQDFFDDPIQFRSSNLLSPETVRNEIVLGVGDKMQVRFTEPVAINWMSPSVTTVK